VKSVPASTLASLEQVLILIVWRKKIPCSHFSFVSYMQEACTAFETCSKPVIVAVQGACVGAGVDMITACDIRICSKDATFCIKEVDLAITADLGTLQRLPLIVGVGRAQELVLTARSLSSSEAQDYGLVTTVSDSHASLLRKAFTLASVLASKPRLALMGTKRVMLHGRGQQVQAGLEHVALWNSSMLWSHELQHIMQQLPDRSRL
jgi:Delta3,5-Delta2,4-dienoyl-CoA isomerase